MNAYDAGCLSTPLRSVKGRTHRHPRAPQDKYLSCSPAPCSGMTATWLSPQKVGLVRETKHISQRVKEQRSNRISAKGDLTGARLGPGLTHPFNCFPRRFSQPFSCAGAESGLVVVSFWHLFQVAFNKSLRNIASGVRTPISTQAKKTATGTGRLRGFPAAWAWCPRALHRTWRGLAQACPPIQ